MPDPMTNRAAPVFCDDRGWIVNVYKWEDTHYCFYNGLGGVKAKGKWGFIDKQGRFVIPCRWDWAGNFTDSLAPVKDGDKWGCIDRTGALVIPCRWDEIGRFTDGIAPVKDGDKWGYIDRTGALVIPPQWEQAGPFLPGIGNYAVVRKNGLYGLIDPLGKPVIPCRWQFIGYYYEKRWIMVCNDRSGPRQFWVWHHYDLETGQTLEAMNNDEDGYGRDLIDVL